MDLSRRSKTTHPLEYHSDIEAFWGYDACYDEYTVSLAMQNAAEHNFVIFENQRNIRIVSTIDLLVPPQHRQKGYGAKLLRAGLALAQDYGAKFSMSRVYSPYSLMIRRSIFGNDGIRFADPANPADYLPIDANLAIQSLARECERAGDNGTGSEGLIVRSNLGKLATNGWPRPLEKNSPQSVNGTLTEVYFK